MYPLSILAEVPKIDEKILSVLFILEKPWEQSTYLSISDDWTIEYGAAI